MAKEFITTIEGPIFEDEAAISLDLFEKALWRRRLSDSEDGGVAVALSTGKTVKVNSKILGFLRVLVDELAWKEGPLN